MVHYPDPEQHTGRQQNLCFRSFIGEMRDLHAGQLGLGGTTRSRRKIRSRSDRVTGVTGSKTLYTYFLSFENHKKEYFWI